MVFVGGSALVEDNRYWKTANEVLMGLEETRETRNDDFVIMSYLFWTFGATVHSSRIIMSILRSVYSQPPPHLHIM